MGKNTMTVPQSKTLVVGSAGDAQLPAVPDFMQEDARMGLQDVGQFVVPPRLKIVQKQSRKELLDIYNMGDVLAMPSQELIASVLLNEKNKPTDLGSPFHFVPLYFYVEWACWNPYEASQLGAIRYRTTNPSDPIVQKAKNSALRASEPCPEMPTKNLRYVEHLNFLVLLLGEYKIAGSPIILSFARGSYKNGSDFCALTRTRKTAAIFGAQYECTTQRVERDGNDWYVPVVTNPSLESGVSPWVQDQAAYSKLRELHLEFDELHKAGRVRVDYDDPSDTLPADSGEF
jgi:hypothetical protein